MYDIFLINNKADCRHVNFQDCRYLEYSTTELGSYHVNIIHSKKNKICSCAINAIICINIYKYL